MSRAGPHDAIVVGGGHNGLVAAAYLARRGLRTLVLERRGIVGGACVTEEIAPGVRASTTSYIASMLRPEIIRGLDLPRHGLRMVPCEPGLQVAFRDGEPLAWWSDMGRTAAGIERRSAKDARAFVDLDAELKRLTRYLQPYFLEPPPNLDARGVRRMPDLLRAWRRLRRLNTRDAAGLVSMLTGSLADLVHRRFESEEVRTLLLANNLYGKHGGPYEAGSAVGLVFHLLSGGPEEAQGYMGHVIGGMGAITQALASAAREARAEIRTEAQVERVLVRNGSATGVALADGTELEATVVLSNADPKRTFLGLVEKQELPDDFRADVEAIRMDGPCAKVNLALSEEPRVVGLPADADPGRRALFTLVPSLAFAQRSADDARRGLLSDSLWVDCVVASIVDPTLAPEDTHVMTCFVQYVPYRLAEGTWDERRDELGDRVIETIARYAPNVPGSVLARQVLTPLDLERTYGLTEGNIFHGDLSLDRLFFMRPVPGWSGYRTPIHGLYLCGAGAHPGGGVTGAPGYNAARRVLSDLHRGGIR
ncbi:MAG TPA: NAD(P)/FAD-dependent oxidoreductase [Actinomycetota bacterium]